jgi:hypothetical protein
MLWLLVFLCTNLFFKMFNKLIVYLIYIFSNFCPHRLNMELLVDLQSLFALHVHTIVHCAVHGSTGTHWLRSRNPPPSPRIWAHIRGRYWSAKIDDISLWPSWLNCSIYEHLRSTYCIYGIQIKKKRGNWAMGMNKRTGSYSNYYLSHF